MKKLISGILGLALAGLFAMPVHATPTAGVTKALRDEYVAVMNERRFAGVFAELNKEYEEVINEEREKVVEILNKEAVARQDRWDIWPEMKFVPVYPEYEINLITILAEAEAEGEPELGKRLVIDTVINRMISGKFPNTVEGIIFQKDQFESMWNGRVNQVSVDEDTRRLVIEELHSTTNRQVLYFKTKNYFPGHVALCNVGHHYFSTKI